MPVLQFGGRHGIGKLDVWEDGIMDLKSREKYVEYGLARAGSTAHHGSGEIFLAASTNFPFATRSMNSGIWTLTGHPFTHCGFLHWMQRFASDTAISSV